jgi:hypothetical protein
LVEIPGVRSAGNRLAANGRRTRDLKSRPRRTTAPSQCQQQCRAKSSRAPDGFPRPALLCLPYCQHGMPGISRRGAERPNPTGPRSAAISDRQGAFRGPHCGRVLSVSVRGSVYFPGAAPPRCVFRPHNFTGGEAAGQNQKPGAAKGGQPTSPTLNRDEPSSHNLTTRSIFESGRRFHSAVLRASKAKAGTVPAAPAEGFDASPLAG